MKEELLSELESKLSECVERLGGNLSKVRTGRASVSFLDGVKVDYYGSRADIKSVGQVSTPEARLLQIQPFDKTMIGAIEKAILGANLGVTPSNDGNIIRLPFPAVTEEKRRDLVKQVKKIGEDSKIQVRNARRDQNDKVKKSEKKKEISEDDSKKLQEEVQKVTDSYVTKIDEVVQLKEKELMTV